MPLLVVLLLGWSGGWVGAGGMGVKTKPSPAKIKLGLSLAIVYFEETLILEH